MSFKIVPRPSQERGSADHGWLRGFHTFSFASYADEAHSQFGALRVINEDRVSPNTGFGTHGHSNFEIFSYVVSGELEHRDSMGNVEILKRGDLQLTSAGTGIRHSEVCHGPKEVHFLQIWSHPRERNLPPKYFTRHFTDEEKKDKWARIVAPITSDDITAERDASGPAPVQSPVTLYASLISPSISLPFTVPTSASAQPRKVYVHVAQTSGYNPKTPAGAKVKISGDGAETILREGDGAYVWGESGKELKVENLSEGGKVAEVLLFDLE